MRYLPIVLAFLIAPAIAAHATTLDFEGITPFLGMPLDYYDGNGGPDLGIVFTPATTVVTEAFGFSFGNEPSPISILAISIMFGLGPVGMDVTDGFVGSLGFSHAGGNLRVSVFDGLGGAGNLLATTDIVPTGDLFTWTVANVPFAGTARSATIEALDFDLNGEDVGIDDMNLQLVPEPSRGGLVAAGLAAAILWARTRRRSNVRGARRVPTLRYPSVPRQHARYGSRPSSGRAPGTVDPVLSPVP